MTNGIDAPTTISGTSREVAVAVGKWIDAEWRNGTALFALEGVSGAGKTTLSKSLKAEVPAIQLLELDQWLEPRHRTWEASLNSDAVQVVLAAHLRTRMPVLVEGIIAWPTVQRVSEVKAKRLYLKRMQFRNLWADELELTTRSDPGTVRRWVQDYHLEFQPIESADLIIERVGSDS